MKTIKEQADELVKLHFGEIANAITSVEYTIDYLKLLSGSFIIDPNKQESFDIIAFSIYKQTELLTELKSRL